MAAEPSAGTWRLVVARPVVVPLAVALVAGFALGAYAARRWDTRATMPVQIARDRVQRAVQVAARADTIWRTDTFRLTRYLTRYDTARVRDTVVRDSVVYVRAGAADSVVRACRAVVSSCSVALAARDSVIAAQRVEIQSERATRPPLLRRVVTSAAWFGAGYVAGRLTPLVGVRF